MSADDRGQWPFPSQRTGDIAPVIIKAAAQSKANCIDLLAMLKRMSNLLASVALLD